MSRSAARRVLEWNAAVAGLLQRLGGPGLSPGLLAALAGLVKLDYPALMLVFREGHAPAAVHGPEATEATRRNVEEYLAGPYVLDPYYLAGVAGQGDGFYRLSDLAPAGFRSTEYYRTYYGRTGMVDEAGYLARVAPDTFVNVSLGRVRPPRFGRVERECLALASPLVCTLLAEHWRRRDRRGGAEPADARHGRLQHALAAFGRAALSPREHEVLGLVLRGHSTKGAAERLGIAAETVKLHRRHIYEKLGVRGQSALFAQFIASLEEGGSDPAGAGIAAGVRG